MSREIMVEGQTANHQYGKKKLSSFSKAEPITVVRKLTTYCLSLNLRQPRGVARLSSGLYNKYIPRHSTFVEDTESPRNYYGKYSTKSFVCVPDILVRVNRVKEKNY